MSDRDLRETGFSPFQEEMRRTLRSSGELSRLQQHQLLDAYESLLEAYHETAPLRAPVSSGAGPRGEIVSVSVDAPRDNEAAIRSADAMMHQLWTHAVDTSGYVKEDWKELERRIWAALRGSSSGAPPQEITSVTLTALRHVMQRRGITSLGRADDARRWSLDDFFTDLYGDLNTTGARSSGAPEGAK